MDGCFGFCWWRRFLWCLTRCDPLRGPSGEGVGPSKATPTWVSFRQPSSTACQQSRGLPRGPHSSIQAIRSALLKLARFLPTPWMHPWKLTELLFEGFLIFPGPPALFPLQLWRRDLTASPQKLPKDLFLHLFELSTIKGARKVNTRGIKMPLCPPTQWAACLWALRAAE